MAEFIAASLPQGPFRAEIAQLFKKYNVQYRISMDVDVLTSFLIYLQECAGIANLEKRICDAAMGNFLPPPKSGIIMRVALGCGDRFDAIPSGKASINTQGPAGLNATDILLGTAPGDSSVVETSGNPEMKSIVKEEGEENPLFTQNPLSFLQQGISPFSLGQDTQVVKEEVDGDEHRDSGAVEEAPPPLQPWIYSQFALGQDAQVVKGEVDGDDCQSSGADERSLSPPPLAYYPPLGSAECAQHLVNEEIGGGGDGFQNTGTSELLVKEEEMNDEFGDSEDRKEEIGGKDMEEMHQAAPDALQLAGSSATYDLFKCTFCNFVLPNFQFFEEHQTIHPKCHICGIRFITQRSLVSHSGHHTGAKRFECRECLKRFVSRRGLETHLRTHIDDARARQCPECQKTFPYVTQLYAHREREHGLRSRVKHPYN